MLNSKIILFRFFAIVDSQTSFTLCFEESEIVERSDLESDIVPPTPHPWCKVGKNDLDVSQNLQPIKKYNNIFRFSDPDLLPPKRSHVMKQKIFCWLVNYLTYHVMAC